MGGTSRWNTDLLRQLAQRGDPLADDVVRRLFEEQALAGVQHLLDSLTRNHADIPEDLPDYVKAYFETLPVDDAELRKAIAGETFFAEHGPEIMMVLCCYSLPFDYANAQGVAVLERTGFLAKEPNLRVAQTAQMIVDVLAPGGLGARGFGVRSAQKVRLIHAAIRCMLLTSETLQWDRRELGMPISQLHLLYTLMSFTQVVLSGLERLGLQVSPREAQAYLDVWRLVGRILGIQPELLPATVDEAAELTQTLSLESQGSTSSGEQLTLALTNLVGDVLGPLAFLRFSLIRYFTGPRLARLLGLPRRPLLDWLIGGIAWVARAIDRFRSSSKGYQLAFRVLTLRLIQILIDKQVGMPRRLFQIPTTVQEDWKTQSRRKAA
jgi:hypothetical protein